MIKFIYAPIVSSNSYTIEMVGLKIDDETIKNKLAMVDIGTSCLSIPA